MNAPQRLTDQLQAWRSGDAQLGVALNDEIYASLKRLARARVSRGSATPTLTPTALVNEAMVRLLGNDADWQSRAHFYGLAASAMRSVLVDAARRRGSDKRGSGAMHVTLDAANGVAATDTDFLDLHEALEVLAGDDPRTARVVELTYFGGLNAREVGDVVGASVATVERDLAFGRAWLQRQLAA